MSESSNETGASTPSGDERRPPAPPETGLIEDEQLPEDLRPAENPLARQPGDEDEDEDGTGTTGGGSPKVDGMPDVGQPGA